MLCRMDAWLFLACRMVVLRGVMRGAVCHLMSRNFSASGEFPYFLLRLCETDCVDDEDEGEDWD